jgi:AraC-like DNA-binding protein
MSVLDKRRSLYVPVAFNPTEDFFSPHLPGYIVLALVTDGKAVVTINRKPTTLLAPCVLCLTERDVIEAVENQKLYAQSFSFDLIFLRNRASFKSIKEGGQPLNSFYCKDSIIPNVLSLAPDAYIKIHELMAVIGTEIHSQSDSRWTCRVRAYFIRILNMLDEINDGRHIERSGTRRSYVDEVLEYLHNHYMEQVTLESLCKRTHTNRTALNANFKARTGRTVIAYLLDYRLRTATELLAHTSLTIGEIAYATGFSSDLYLIKQFTLKSSQTPTEYRTEARRKHNIVVDKGI